MSARAEIIQGYSRAVCPTCRALVDAVRILREGKVYLRRHCPSHGPSESLISGDADWFTRSLTFTKPGSIPLAFARPVRDGCPTDCGLCPDHEQHSCLPIIEITDHCDLDCPICLVDNRHQTQLTPAQVDHIIDGLIAAEGTLDTVNFSGGEPTSHPQLLELVDLALRPEIARVSISTNGVRLARDLDLCRELARRGVYVNLQLDALRPEPLRTLRGADLLALKHRALDNLEAAGVPTTLIATIARGVNEDQVGDLVRLLMERDFLLSLLFQPAAHIGRGEAFEGFDPLDRVTVPDVVRACVEQSRGALAQADFFPLPCSHPSCFALTYLLRLDGGEYVPFPRFIELERYLELVANRGAIQPDAQLEDTLRDVINDLWSGGAQVPDSDRILDQLKRAMDLMYPPERVLELTERLRIGEALVKTVFIHGYMDAHTFELERLRKCCTHYALPDGRLLPGCARNVLGAGG